MQATVLRWDATTSATAIVLDDGVELPVAPEVFARSGLRLLRPGQRVGIRTERDPATGDDRVTAMTLSTFSLPD